MCRERDVGYIGGLSQVQGARCGVHRGHSHVQGARCGAHRGHSHMQGARCGVHRGLSQVQGARCGVHRGHSHVQGARCGAHRGHSHTQGARCGVHGSLTPDPSPRSAQRDAFLRKKGEGGKANAEASWGMSRRIFSVCGLLRVLLPIWVVPDTGCLRVSRTLCMRSAVRRIQGGRCEESCLYIQCSCRS